jgi:hypothetical protein
VLVESLVIEMPECLYDSRCPRVTFISEVFIQEASIVQRLSRCLRGTFIPETFVQEVSIPRCPRGTFVSEVFVREASSCVQ